MKNHSRRNFMKAGAAAAVAATTVTEVFANDTPTATDEFINLDATAQAELVKSGQVTAKELAEAAIVRIEKLNPELNGVVTKIYDRGLEKAAGPLPEGPFQGVPFLLKDLIEYEGVRLTYGCHYFRNNVATKTNEVARRMEGTGLVVLGKTNTPEFGLLPVTESVLLKAAHNPWNLEHSTGGSSGGSAASVAAGLVPFAQASDGGGSIRIPASACGLFGLKPSRGRTAGDSRDISVRHCVSRSVRDSATLLRATDGYVPGDRYFAPPVKWDGHDGRKLRIAYSTKSLLGTETHPDCVAAVESAAKLCAELGHEVVQADPDIPYGQRFTDSFLLVWSNFAAGIIGGITKLFRRVPKRQAFEEWTWVLAEHSLKHEPADVDAAWGIFNKAARDIGKFHEDYDVWLTPTLGAPPVKIGEFPQNVSYDEMVAKLLPYVAFTPIANAIGNPSMSVPLHWNDAGLPIGTMFSGPFASEGMMLHLASQLEEARPWAGRWAPHSAANLG